MTLGNSLKLITNQGQKILVKVRPVLIGIFSIGLGILLGLLMRSTGESGLIISIVIVLILLVIIANNPLAGLLLLLFFTVFIETWVEIPLGAGIPDLSFSRFSIAFLAIFMLANAAVGKFRFVRISLTDICIIATCVGILISAPLADNPKGVIQTMIALHFTPLIVYFLAKNLVRDKTDLHALFLTIALLGLAVASYAIYEQTTGNILFLPKDKVAENLNTVYTANLRQLRGLLGKPGDFGRVLITTIPLTFYLFFENKTTPRKILLLGIIIVQCIGLFFTYNRTSWYGLLISLTIIQFFYPQFRRLYIVIVFAAVIMLWATWNQVTDSAIVNERINSKVSTLEGRQARWQAGYNMWLVKPIRGWGFGQYQHESGHFRTDGKHVNFEAIENDYLYILVGAGLVGFLPYLLFLLVPLINSLWLLFMVRAPNWSGFIKQETIAVYWGIVFSFALGSYTQIQTETTVKMLPFAVAGAVIGTHEALIRRSKARLG